jgi:hypothetical protein
MSEGAPRIRVWFFRNLLEAAERELGSGQLAGLPMRVPARVKPHLTLDRLRAASPIDTLSLDEAEEATAAFELALGDSSGRLLERIATDMFGRQLAQAVGVVRIGDLFGTVARLRGPLEHPFVDASLHFELTRTATGFQLTLGVAGRSRATRLLGHLGVAAVHAAERFAREAQAEPLRVQLESVGDRARMTVRFRRASTIPPPSPLPMSVRRSSGATRLIPSLSDEVARILDPTFPSERIRANGDTAHTRSEPPPSRRASDPPPAMPGGPARSGSGSASATGSPRTDAEAPEAKPARDSTRPPPERS